MRRDSIDDVTQILIEVVNFITPRSYVCREYTVRTVVSGFPAKVAFMIRLETRCTSQSDFSTEGLIMKPTPPVAACALFLHADDVIKRWLSILSCLISSSRTILSS